MISGLLMNSFIAMFWLHQPIDLARTWVAVCMVESGGQSDAVGDAGEAIGIAQIHKVCVDDVNRIKGRQEFTYGDRLDPQKSFLMFQTYVLHYYPKGGPEQWARCWNGGPKGPSKQATLKYWVKVQRRMSNVTR